MYSGRRFPTVAPALALVWLCGVPAAAYPDHIVVALFVGFSADAEDPNAGMRVLANRLANEFGNIPDRPLFIRVFQGSERGVELANDFFRTFVPEHGCFVIIGHSMGGDAAIAFARDFLRPDREVDLLVQIDSVGINDEVVPDNVSHAFNYYQISTGLFEPQGAMNVMGATNINVETLFPEPPIITHTSIDEDPRLHNLIVNNVADVCEIPEPSTLTLVGLTTLGLVGYGYRRRKRAA